MQFGFMDILVLCMPSASCIFGNIVIIECGSALLLSSPVERSECLNDMKDAT